MTTSSSSDEDALSLMSRFLPPLICMTLVAYPKYDIVILAVGPNSSVNHTLSLVNETNLSLSEIVAAINGSKVVESRTLPYAFIEITINNYYFRIPTDLH